MAPMPAAGRQLEPDASVRITNSNRREEVDSERSKKMPPRKGRKNCLRRGRGSEEAAAEGRVGLR